MTQTKKTILIVDDEEDLREAMVFDFKRKGFEVKSASNGVEAFKIVETELLDVVLTDARMPNGDGLELINKMRERNHALPPVILVTGFADITAEQAYARGCDGIFAKPFDRKALFEYVDRCTVSAESRFKRKDGLSEVNMAFGLKLMRSNQVIESKAISFGRGGMFCILNHEFPSLGENIEFNLATSVPQIKQIAGRGVVRWTRATAQENLTIGCGIEITDLNDDCRKSVIEWMESLKTKCYIPRN